jgi:cyclopropane-fatty-acyl-phospholipid synthase
VRSPGIGARLVDAVVDLGVLPDPCCAGRSGCCSVAGSRSITAGTVEQRSERKRALVAALAGPAPVAIDTDEANDQHYEVPTELFELMLGPAPEVLLGLVADRRLDLAHAEEAMLRLTCERAELADGQDILELGCGWGSLTLWMAERYPRPRGSRPSRTPRRSVSTSRSRRRRRGSTTSRS